MSDFTPRYRSTALPGTRTTLAGGRIHFPPRPALVSPGEAQRRELVDRARTFGHRLTTLNAAKPASPVPTAPTTATDQRRSSLSQP
jgi:hypothetical protein